VPELPDVTVYIEALERKLLGETLSDVALASPFLLRSVEPPLSACYGKKVEALSRIGKRIAFHFEDELYLVIHLMVSGRFRWSDKLDAKPPGRAGLAAFHFTSGTLLMTEASKKKRASLHVAQGEGALAGFDPGGLEVLDNDGATFAERLRSRSHTLKRALTDPRLFSGIGGAYSDEILHRAKLSPIKLTGKLDDDEVGRLYGAAVEVLGEWTERFREEVGEGFPGKVTAFRPEMAVHGKFREPCPVCGTKVQRIVHAENETNYCPRCQTDGKLLADRSLSRLLKKDWPRTIDELERLRGDEP
jgi:formamidopyrimidine-DNA glycosylase